MIDNELIWCERCQRKLTKSEFSQCGDTVCNECIEQMNFEAMEAENDN